MSTTRPDLSALHKQVRVPQEPPAAFRLFTAELGAWWPLDTHSVGQERATAVVLEPEVGGRVVETFTDEVDGRERTATWGTVLVWDPPHRVAMTWHPGTPEAEATEVEVRFTPDGGGTLVQLVHSGWDRRPDGAPMRGAYDGGWELVLGRLATHGLHSDA